MRLHRGVVVDKLTDADITNEFLEELKKANIDTLQIIKEQIEFILAAAVPDNA